MSAMAMRQKVEEKLPTYMISRGEVDGPEHAEVAPDLAIDDEESSQGKGEQDGSGCIGEDGI